MTPHIHNHSNHNNIAFVSRVICSSTMLLLLLVLFCCCLETSLVRAQSCRLTSKLLTTEDDDFVDACRPYLNNPRFLIYVNDTFDTKAVRREYYQALNSFKLLPSTCRTPALRLFCPLFFRKLSLQESLNLRILIPSKSTV